MGAENSLVHSPDGASEGIGVKGLGAMDRGQGRYPAWDEPLLYVWNRYVWNGPTPSFGLASSARRSPLVRRNSAQPLTPAAKLILISKNCPPLRKSELEYYAML